LTIRLGAAAVFPFVKLRESGARSNFFPRRGSMLRAKYKLPRAECRVDIAALKPVSK